jgi:hypothetical protein
MNNYQFETSELVGAEIDLFVETFNELKKRLPVEFDNDHKLNFQGFELFNHYVSFKIMATIRIERPNSNVHVNFTKVSFCNYHTGHSQTVYTPTVSNMQAWTVATLNKDFGHVIIKQETIIDTITDLITHTELKFPDDKHFSKKFYVLAADHDKALSAMTFAFRNALLDMVADDMLIEIIGKQLIIGNQKPIEPEQTVKMAALADKVAALR